MHGFTSQVSRSAQQWLSNESITQDYADYSMYNIWVPCTALVDSSGVAVVSNINDVPVKIYPDGVTTESVYAFRKPIQWKDGTCSLRVHYTGDVVSGKSVSLRCRFNQYIIGDTIGTSSFGSTTVPSPRSAYSYEMSDDFMYSTSSTTSERIVVTDRSMFISLSIGRRGALGGDDYTSDFCLIGVEVVYIENKHSGYGKSVDKKWIK